LQKEISDLKSAQTSLQTHVTQSVENLRSELKSDISDLRSTQRSLQRDTVHGIAQLQGQLQNHFNELRSTIRNEAIPKIVNLAKQVDAIQTYGLLVACVIALLLLLLRFI
jgi:FtsZ-binding cell division protein ZapB